MSDSYALTLHRLLDASKKRIKELKAQLSKAQSANTPLWPSSATPVAPSSSSRPLAARPRPS